MMNAEEKAFIFGSIFTLSNRLQILGDKFDKNLTIKQWLLLAGITKFTGNAPALSEVAALTGNSRQNVKKMALILEREDFLSINKDPSDGRVLRLSLTAKCLDYFKNREKREDEFLEQLFTGFDRELIMRLCKGIQSLSDNVKEMEKLYDFKEEE